MEGTVCGLGMNKTALIQAVVAALGAELEVYIRAAQASHAEATHEQSRAENKYDTRGLEAAYLARGQSKQIAELELAIKEFQRMKPRAFAEGDPIDMGAWVELETKGEAPVYFIGPKSGGLEVRHDGRDLLVMTPQSPLGSQLMGRRQGETLTLLVGGTRSRYRVKRVC